MYDVYIIFIYLNIIYIMLACRGYPSTDELQQSAAAVTIFITNTGPSIQKKKVIIFNEFFNNITLC